MASIKDMLKKGLVDLKRDKSAVEKMPMETKIHEPEYDYGLEISLEKNSLKKLGISPSDFKVGDMVSMVGEAKICGISVSENFGGSGHQSVRLQIQKLSIGESK